MDKKLGFEPAFPPSREMQELAPACEGYHVGMSKRFYAACAAMQGILANTNIASGKTRNTSWHYAKMAFDCADQLLKQEYE